MREQRKSISGPIVFGCLAIVLMAAIGATVLLANDYRNLNLLLARLGYAPIDAGSRARTLHSYEMKGNRLPRPKGLVSARLIAPAEHVRARFVRTIRKAPEALCEALRQSGFANSGWKAGLLATDSWECQSYREFPDATDGENPPSSIFLSIRGNAETRITSFRIKLNIENGATRQAVTGAAVTAIQVFLEEVRWEDAPEIFADIRTLMEFDLVRFGNRLQLRKEFGETPRYNFLVTPDRSTRTGGTGVPDYFDRSRWIVLPDNP